MKLSIIIPVYNEEKWVAAVIDKVAVQPVPGVTARELVIVDDGSTDRSAEVIRDLARQYPGTAVEIICHERNLGKGASIRSALHKVTGDICIIQDADLEYDPSNYPELLGPLVQGQADCVFGSRFQGSQPKRVLFYWHYAGNKFLTNLCNIFANVNLTDMETGYKAFRTELLKSIPIESDRFGFEPEITIKVARKNIRMYEVGISYYGRTYEEGKKITWKDGLRAIGSIIKFGIQR